MTQALIVGRNIKLMREERCWNQEDLAAKLDISRKTVSAWETGRACPRMGVVEKLKEIFNCTTSDILNEKSNITKKPEEEIIGEKCEYTLDHTTEVFMDMWYQMTDNQRYEMIGYALEVLSRK